ncbi:hypothetical protein B0J13DRAFT_637658 [Dactylonectria estremocensis]|uniref:Uncharacterized protein n=1 Tax=Dactylonectria estremocensis TaxID=1079267 RepID=A0A9P9ENB4_9HYPO|nr:hypothetical protein B0J13DRAFT_637658 [Dactylonectria estremocensis]
MICETCQTTFERCFELSKPSWTSDSYWFSHHTTIQSLQSSAEQGCFVCAAFWSSINTNDRKALGGSMGSLQGGHEHYAPEPSELRVASSTPTTVNNLNIHLKLAPTVKGDIGLCVAGDHFQPNPWNCVKNHSKCNAPSEGTWYPTRLLDLGPLPPEGPTTVELVETTATTPNGPYKTLSHCWGNDHSMTLSRETCQELLGGVPLSSLPQTFQDALVVHTNWVCRDPSVMPPPVSEVALPSSHQGDSKLTAKYDISNALF